ncbi:MAG: UbiH/UbiF/VisC/COQ6 family ubiquinone biosynthesis hydroxylase [Hyphomonadaceae bacterium]
MSDLENVISADVAIVGGGPVGLTLALALDQAGVSVAVIDAAPPKAGLDEHFDGRAFAIAFANYRMWRALGLTGALDPVVQPIREILVTDGRVGEGASPWRLHFDFDELGGEEALGYMVEHRHLRAALDAAVRARAGIRLIAPMRVALFSHTQAHAEAILADGRRVRCGLLVGADGRQSSVRAHMGAQTIGRDYASTAIVATVRHEKPHQGVAHELFLPSGPFAILPLKGERANIVWAEPHAAANTLLAMTPADFCSELSLRFGDFLGGVELEGPRFSYPLSMKLAERMIGPRMALAGDSAHAIHPIAGQGLNLGLKDVAALAECISDTLNLGLDAGDVTALERYQRWRRFDNIAMANAMDGFDRLFSNDHETLRRVRGVGLALVNSIGPARRYFMRAAGGTAPGMPKLLRGVSLAA